MKKDRLTAKNWCVTGFIMILALGSIFHFMYEWTGRPMIAAIFFPVNESVWEHLKMGFYANLAFSAVEYWFLKGRVNNYFLAKATGNLILALTIVIVFYGYTAILEKNHLLIDILTFTLGAALCQTATYRLFRIKEERSGNELGKLFLSFAVIIFTVFTFYPPHIDVFKDHTNDSYGIYKHGTFLH